MLRSLAAIVVGAALVLTAACAHSRASGPDDPHRVLDYAGAQRHYLIHRPAGSPQGRLAAVLVFHGGGGSAGYMANKSGFDRLADANGFIAVYPEGIGRSWNDGRGADTRAGAADVDDVGFVSALIDHLVAADEVDPARVYATGMSNGGMFTQHLGCHLSAKLAAIAPVAGPLPAADETNCALAHPLPVLEIHGTADPIVPYEGGVVRVTSGNNGRTGTGPVLSVAATQQLWRGKNGCPPPNASELPARGDDGTSVKIETALCPDDVGVVLYTVTNGGHTWPGGEQYLPKALVGAVSRQFDASEIIWQFFAAH
ncbi:PHB depolymerase family esterase [Nocardia sp. NPDC051911]|uniref:extracellular catalytic domain type 1 short-chain-length polyhydroxyalkanoate depolymerase n=1 Tax=Nocardia sp. NPDC051911 TaxID=3154648 RepID=UPI00341E4D73